MRIAIDARLNAYRRGGIPQYTRQLLTALADLAPEEEFVSLQHREMLRPLAVAPNVTRRAVLTPPHHRFEQWTLPLELLAVRPHVLHCPDFIAPTRRLWPAVVTIHDLAFFRYPDILDDEAKAYYGRVRESSARADAVIAVSEATRQDIAQFCDIPIEEIDLIYEAAAPVFRRMELRAGEVRVLNQVPVEAGSFMLFVSTLEPRKNLPTLLKALRVCIDRKPERPYSLVIAGGRGWRDEPIYAAVRELDLGEHVLFAGNVGQYDLRWLYNACRFYVNPSLYEGFGLPLLEAMACGAACVAAETSSLPEIGGDAALYVPPLDVQGWADTIEGLWDDEQRREDLGRLAQGRSMRFSWSRAARETLRVYSRVAEQRAQGAPLGTRGPVRRPAEALAAASALTPDGTPRPCLRCGTALVAGPLEPLVARGPEAPADPHPLRAWSCPNCGRVEMVVEWEELATPVAHSGAAAPAITLGAPPADVEEPPPGEPAEEVTITEPAAIEEPEPVPEPSIAIEPMPVELELPAPTEEPAPVPALVAADGSEPASEPSIAIVAIEPMPVELEVPAPVEEPTPVPVPVPAADGGPDEPALTLATVDGEAATPAPAAETSTAATQDGDEEAAIDGGVSADVAAGAGPLYEASVRNGAHDRGRPAPGDEQHLAHGMNGEAHDARGEIVLVGIEAEPAAGSADGERPTEPSPDSAPASPGAPAEEPEPAKPQARTRKTSRSRRKRT